MILNKIELDRILGLVQGHYSQKQMHEKLKLKPSTLSMRLKRMQEAGFIRKIPGTKPAFFELLPRGEIAIQQHDVQSVSLGMRTPLIKVHNFSIEMPLIQDLSTGFWEKSWDLNNWAKQFKDAAGLGISLERTTRTVTVNFKPLEVRKEDILPLVLNIFPSIVVLLEKEGIKVDSWKAKVVRQEYAQATALVKPFTDEGMTIRASLGRPQARIMAGDTPREAAAWLDASKFQGVRRPEIDTNDLAYAQHIDVATAVLQTPEAMRKILGMGDDIKGLWELQKTYADNLKLHMGVMKDIQKWVRKASRQLDQKKVTEYFRPRGS